MGVADSKQIVNQVGSEKLSRLIRLIGMLDWQGRVERIREALRLPPSEVIEEPSTLLPADSWPVSLGHKTIKDFITEPPESKFGLGLSWDSWVIEAKASRLKNTFSVQFSDPSVIISEYEGVESTLGRAPVSAGEFHSVRDALIRAQHSREIDNLKRQRHALKERIRKLNGELEQQSVKGSQAQERADNLLSQIEGLEEEFRNEFQKQAADFNKEIKGRLAEQSEREAEEYISQIKSLTNKINDLKNNYDDSKFVPRSTHDDLKEECLSLEQRVKDQAAVIDELNEKLSIAHSRIKKILSDSKSKSREIEGLTLTISDLRSKLSELKEIKRTVKKEDQPLRSEAIDRLIRRQTTEIEKKTQILIDLKEKYMDLFQKYKEVNGQVSEYRETISILKNQSSAVKKRYKKVSDANDANSLLVKILFVGFTGSIILLAYFFGF